MSIILVCPERRRGLQSSADSFGIYQCLGDPDIETTLGQPGSDTFVQPKDIRWQVHRRRNPAPRQRRLNHFSGIQHHGVVPYIGYVGILGVGHKSIRLFVYKALLPFLYALGGKVAAAVWCAVLAGCGNLIPMFLK